MLRRTLRRAAVGAALLAAALVATVLLGLLTVTEAGVLGGAAAVLGCLGLLAFGLHWSQKRLAEAIAGNSPGGAAARLAEDMKRRFVRSVDELTTELSELRGQVGEQRLEAAGLLGEVPSLSTVAAGGTTDSARTRPVGGAITRPRRTDTATKDAAAKAAAQETASKPADSQGASRSMLRIAGPGGSIIRTGDQTVALTFDDGPEAATTVPLLKLLRRYDVTATFFVVGHMGHLHKDVLARIADEGHVLANHSWSHRMDLAQTPDEVILSELQNTNEVLLKAAPAQPIRHFRTPGGYFNDRIVALAASLGMKSVYWDVDPKDWDTETIGSGQSMVNHIVSVLKQEVKPGSIVLSHDCYKPDTVEAYRILLPWLKDNFNLAPLPFDD